MHFVDKYWFIINHPKLNNMCRQPVIEITPQLVNPKTNSIDDDNSLNTKVEFWVEFMYNDSTDPHLPQHENGHDMEMDCGADTYEDAVDALYVQVLEKFGDY